MASTVSNGNDRSEKWQRPFQMATTVYEREIGFVDIIKKLFFLFPDFLCSGLPLFSSCFALNVVQSLNSPFFPPHIGAEPGRAKRRVQDNLHAHARKAAIFSPKIGGKSHIWKCFPDLVCSAISLNNNIQATIFAV